MKMLIDQMFNDEKRDEIYPLLDLLFKILDNIFERKHEKYFNESSLDWIEMEQSSNQSKETFISPVNETLNDNVHLIIFSSDEG